MTGISAVRRARQNVAKSGAGAPKSGGRGGGWGWFDDCLPCESRGLSQGDLDPGGGEKTSVFFFSTRERRNMCTPKSARRKGKKSCYLLFLPREKKRAIDVVFSISTGEGRKHRLY